MGHCHRLLANSTRLPEPRFFDSFFEAVLRHREIHLRKASPMIRFFLPMRSKKYISSEVSNHESFRSALCDIFHRNDRWRACRTVRLHR
jgi:hypothetical protein